MSAWRCSPFDTLRRVRDRFEYGYWPDLDGLRGVAVLAVIAAHAHVPYTSGGGLTGVTAFFVLSGFLITRLLAAEFSATGRIDFGAFYVRRALRLLPALLLLVAVCAVVYGFTGRIAQIVTTAPPVLLYAGNWVSAFHGPISPFQHTWSLAVEEQFYLLWPVTFLAIALFAGRRGSLAPWKAILGAAIAFALWRSLVWTVTANYDRAYYAFDTNAFALLVGCALGLRPDSLRAAVSPRLLGLVALVGLAVIALDTALPRLVRLDQTGVLMVLPVRGTIGAALVIASRGSGFLVLTNPPLVAIGRISYGLYLWHWVVPRLAEPWLPESGLLRETVSVGATFAISAASFLLLERRALRLKKRWSRRPTAEAVDVPPAATGGPPPMAPASPGGVGG